MDAVASIRPLKGRFLYFNPKKRGNALLISKACQRQISPSKKARWRTKKSSHSKGKKGLVRCYALGASWLQWNGGTLRGGGIGPRKDDVHQSASIVVRKKKHTH